MKLTSFVFVPNYSVREGKEGVELEKNIEDFLLDSCRHFERVIIAGFKDIRPASGSFKAFSIDNLRMLNLKTIKTSLTFADKLWLYFCSLFHIFRLIIDEKFFYIFVPGHVSSLFLMLCCIFRKHYAIYLRGDWDVLTLPIFLPLRKLFFSRAEFLIVTGDLLLKKTRKYNQKCVAVVPMLSISFNDLKIKESYALSGTIRILTVGAVTMAKGIFDLVDSLQYIYAAGHKVELHVVGMGDDIARLKRLAEDKRSTLKILVHGYVSDKRKLIEQYTRSDIFVLPSHHEGFPRVLNEAMAFGLPILTTNVGSIESVMIDKKNCLFINKGDPNDLAAKAIQLIEDQALREQIGTGAFSTAMELFGKFQNNSHGKQFINLLKKTGLK